MKNLLKLSLLMLIITVFISCSKDDDITASVNNKSNSLGNFDGDVTGNGGSVSETFTWNNARTTAEYNMDITATSAGSFRLLIKDADGTTVLDKTLQGNVEPDTFSGVSSAGTAGDWNITLTLTNFAGDGSYSVSSGT